MLDLYDVLCRPVDRGGILEWDKQNKKKGQKSASSLQSNFFRFSFVRIFHFCRYGSSREKQNQRRFDPICSALIIIIFFFLFHTHFDSGAFRRFWSLRRLLISIWRSAKLWKRNFTSFQQFFFFFFFVPLCLSLFLHVSFGSGWF